MELAFIYAHTHIQSWQNNITFSLLPDRPFLACAKSLYRGSFTGGGGGREGKGRGRGRGRERGDKPLKALMTGGLKGAKASPKIPPKAKDVMTMEWRRMGLAGCCCCSSWCWHFRRKQFIVIRSDNGEYVILYDDVMNIDMVIRQQEWIISFHSTDCAGDWINRKFLNSFGTDEYCLPLLLSYTASYCTGQFLSKV